MLLLEIIHLKKSHVIPKSSISLNELKEYLISVHGTQGDNFYFTHNGKLVTNFDSVDDGVIYAIPRLVGGKGGFGSMLRAIGAQIEKTTNREACRDLSGRRLRDINEEKRLKNWIAQQADREREAAEKRRRKLERMCAEPKHEFEDKEYDKQRSELSEKVWDAVDQGMKASTSGPSSSTNSSKRKLSDQETKKKRTRLWVDDIEDEDISSSADSDDSEEGVSLKKVMKGEADQDVKEAINKVDKEATDKALGSENNKDESTKDNGHDCSESVSSEINGKDQLKDSSPARAKEVSTE